MHPDSFEISFREVPDGVRVIALRGREAMSAPHRLDVDVVVTGVPPEAFDDLVLDRAAVLALAPGEPAGRRIGGFVSAVRWLGVRKNDASEGPRTAARVRIEAPIARLRRTRRSRIFQNKTTLEIVTEVLHEHAVPHRLAAAAPLVARVYTVQYRETDLAFVERLLAEEGLFYFHEDPFAPAMEPTLVIADEPAAYPATGGTMPLVARERGGAMLPEEHHAHDFEAERRALPAAARVRAFDPMRPRAPHEAWASAGPTDLAPRKQGEPPATDEERDRYYEHVEDASPRGPALPQPASSAGVLLEQVRRKALRASFNTPCRRLAPGHTFVLAEHELGSLDRPWVVSRQLHTGKASTESGAHEPYRAEVMAAPATMRVRPAPAKKPIAQVAETATVVGPPGVGRGEPHVDEHGRVQVQFPWDLHADGTAGATCWIRVVQAWAGEGWGTQFLPRVGMEVLVTFLGGDPDQPIIAGALPNAVNPLPASLPKGAATSGIKTRSTPGGGGANELLFMDAKGAEEIVLRGEKDIQIAAKEDLRIQAASALTLDAGSDARTRIGGDAHLHVEGDRRTEIQGHCTTTVFETASCTSYRDIHVKALEALHVDAGTHAHLVTGASLVLDVADNVTLRAGAGDSTVQLTAAGTMVLEGSDAVFVTSSKRLVFQVGPTRLEIDANGVKVSGATLGFKATDGIVAEGPGPRLTLGERAEMVAEEIALVSKAAEISLTDKAEVKSEQIKLGGKKKDPEPSKDGEEPKTKKLKAKVANSEFEPYADKHFELLAGGQRITGTTTLDGEVEADVPEEADVAALKVWIDEYPTGRTRTWQLDLVELPPANQPKGALVRLKNLGYHSSEPGDSIDASGRSALVWFQKDHDLEQTGKLDDATAAKLEEVHGS